MEHCWFKPLALPEFAPTLTDLQSKSLLFAELLSRGSLWSLYIFLSSYRCLSSLYFSCLLIIITSFSFPFFYSPLPFPSTHQPPIVYSPSLHSPYSDTMGLNPPGLVTYNTVIRLSARIITADGKIARRIRDSMCIMLDYHNMRIPSSPIHMLQAFNARAPCPSLLRSTDLPILEVSQLHGLLWILPSFTYCR